jgi:hypothetical protein
VLLNPTIPSSGGRNRARNFDNEAKGSVCEAGVNEIFENFSIILDNHIVPLSWATELEIVGSLFFELEKGETEVDIQGLCSSFAQSRTDRNELKRLIKKSPYFSPVTWCTYPLLTGIKIKNSLTFFIDILLNQFIRHQIIKFSLASRSVKVKLCF